MGINYREDPDLMFLQFCDNADLDILVKILIGQESDKRISEKLSEEFRYKHCNGNYKQIWDLIAGELQLFGGDSIANKFRGHGVFYKEIVSDVCKELGEKIVQYDDVNELEIKLILAIFHRLLNGMNKKDCEEFCRIAELQPKNYEPPAVYSEYQKIIRQGGVGAIKTIFIVADGVAKEATGSGLQYIRLDQSAASLKAILLKDLFCSVYGLKRMTGPAFRVTIPSCAIVAYMRRKYLFSNF